MCRADILLLFLHFISNPKHIVRKSSHRRDISPRWLSLLLSAARVYTTFFFIAQLARRDTRWMEKFVYVVLLGGISCLN